MNKTVKATWESKENLQQTPLAQPIHGTVEGSFHMRYLGEEEQDNEGGDSTGN